MPDLAAQVAKELAQYRSSDNPIWHAIADLYQQGLVVPDGLSEGQIIWRAVETDSEPDFS